jgi:hypothetical protein
MSANYKEISLKLHGWSIGKTGKLTRTAKRTWKKLTTNFGNPLK